jgi:hypothetical protein
MCWVFKAAHKWMEVRCVLCVCGVMVRGREASRTDSRLRRRSGEARREAERRAQVPRRASAASARRKLVTGGDYSRTSGGRISWELWAVPWAGAGRGWQGRGNGAMGQWEWHGMRMCIAAYAHDNAHAHVACAFPAIIP